MLHFDRVSVILGGKPILQDVSFSLRPHRLTVLVGKNGSGKSTLLSCVNQQFPYSGTILCGQDDLARIPPNRRAQTVAILPQALPAPHITAREMAAFGRNPYLDFTGRMRDADRAAVTEALRQAQAESLADRYLDTLSGGERQRVALAMILAQQTPVALLDEPTAHMDLEHEAAFLQTLVRLRSEQQKTFLVVLHDLSAAVQYADDLVVLDAGKLVFSGTREACLQDRVLETTFGVRRYTFEGPEGQKIFFQAE